MLKEMLGILNYAVNKVLIGKGDSGSILPPSVSAGASEVDKIFFLILTITTFFFLLIVGLMILFIILYRHRRGSKPRQSPHHNFLLEFTWSVIPLILVFVIFFVGFKGYMDMSVSPLETYEINVTGQRWNWLFTYANGYVDKELHVPSGVSVSLVITSEDVIHSLFIPALRLKRDAVPGRYAKIWFKAIEPGEYPIYCAEYCGTGHSTMLTKLIVHEPGEFDKWLEDSASFVKNLPPTEAGQKLYETRGCMQCHSVDGTVKIGPTFKDLFGEQVALMDRKKVTVDENYVRESIVDPQAKVVAGFDPVMPTYKGRLKDEEISAIIAFLKTLSEKGRSVLKPEEEAVKGNAGENSSPQSVSDEGDADRVSGETLESEDEEAEAK